MCVRKEGSTTVLVEDNKKGEKRGEKRGEGERKERKKEGEKKEFI